MRVVGYQGNKKVQKAIERKATKRIVSRITSQWYGCLLQNSPLPTRPHLESVTNILPDRYRRQSRVLGKDLMRAGASVDEMEGTDALYVHVPMSDFR